MEWVELVPKGRDQTFDRIRLGFADGKVRFMEMVDNFGQTTLLRLGDVERNVPVPASAFQFTPPPGVDVIGER